MLEETALREFLEFFNRLSIEDANGANLSICFSSRHYPFISLEKGRLIHVEDKNESDIAAYVHSELNRKLQNKSEA